jgi:hypothetical protein
MKSTNRPIDGLVKQDHLKNTRWRKKALIGNIMSNWSLRE